MEENGWMFGVVVATTSAQHVARRLSLTRVWKQRTLIRRDRKNALRYRSYFQASSGRLTTIGSEVLLITTRRKGNSFKSENRNTEFAEEHRVSQRPPGRRNFRQVTYCQTEALRFKISNSDPGHIFRRENTLEKSCRRRADLEHSGGEANEDLGGKFTCHIHKKLESLAGNATVSTLRKLNCGSTCKRHIAGVFQNQALSSMVVHNQKAIGIGLAHQRKNGPIFLYI
jgi:hypothetical protein